MVISLKAKKALYCSTICKAWCCRNLIMKYTADEKDINILFKLRGIQYNTDTKEMVMQSKCAWVTNHNKCRMYAFRPYPCRVYECDTLKKMVADN